MNFLVCYISNNQKVAVGHHWEMLNLNRLQDTEAKTNVLKARMDLIYLQTNRGMLD